MNRTREDILVTRILWFFYRVRICIVIFSAFYSQLKMDLAEKLKAYFENNTEEKILEDWGKSKKYDEVGITADDFFKIQPAKTIQDVEEWCKRQLNRIVNR